MRGSAGVLGPVAVLLVRVIEGLAPPCVLAHLRTPERKGECGVVEAPPDITPTGHRITGGGSPGDTVRGPVGKPPTAAVRHQGGHLLLEQRRA